MEKLENLSPYAFLGKNEYRPKIARVVGYAATMAGMIGLAALWCFAPNSDHRKYYSHVPDGATDAEKLAYRIEEGWRFLQLLLVLMLNYVGFPLLMVFPRKATSSVLAFAFKTASISFLLITFLHSMVSWHFDDDEIPLVHVILEASFGVAAAQIVFSSVEGNVSHFQVVVIAISVSVFYTLNLALNVRVFKVMDVGGSILVHLFGGLFALSCNLGLFGVNYTLHRADKTRAGYRAPDDGAWRTGDALGYAGTLILFVTWPAFAAGLTPLEHFFGSGFNCIIALCASSVSAFVSSALAREIANKDGTFRFDNVDIINATLAGGVAVGATVDAALPFGIFVLLGVFVGFVSSFGFTFVSPFLLKKIGLHDTCGVLNLHVIPSIIGILWSLPVIYIILDNDGGDDVLSYAITEAPHDSIAASVGYQIAGMLATMFIAVCAGFTTGLVAGKLDPLTSSKTFDDEEWFRLEYPEMESASETDVEAPLEPIKPSDPVPEPTIIDPTVDPIPDETPETRDDQTLPEAASADESALVAANDSEGSVVDAEDQPIIVAPESDEENLHSLHDE
ncbi:Ammonium Transporter Family [Carpediemonas membranifera]|uniref:Ammonium Transporter Family n=1 Tax=Carpediemonas membranifera TaxID=201153 RepID=A0A8J6E6I9_9EUKA|nr:Ammonium Transporter Family [Carpediemonas membranifera]|eukprot:KAG9397162.1 Ammonium Transporter Family [Carpediemonas membranifera]